MSIADFMGLVTKLPLATEEKLSELFHDIGSHTEDYVRRSLANLKQRDHKFAEILAMYSLFTRQNPDVFLGTGLFVYDGLSKEGDLPILTEAIVPVMQKKIRQRMAGSIYDYFQEIGTLVHDENPVLEKYLITICQTARNIDKEAGYDALFGGLFTYDHLRTQAEVNNNSLN